jgi:DNA-binding LacI/PurR family transcriptional regulator
VVSRSRLDNSLLAQLSHIDLTSVSQEPREQATVRSRRRRRLDSGRTDAVSWVLQPRLIVRDTTAPASASKNASAT